MEQELARLNHAPSAPGTAAAAVRPGGWPSVRAGETLNGVLPCASFPCRAHNFSLCRSPARPAGKARRAYRETQPPARRQGEDHTDHSEGRATVEGFPSSAGKRKRRRVAEAPDRTAGNRWETLQQTQCRTVPIGGKRLALCNGRRERRLTSLSITTPRTPPQRGRDLRRPTPLLSEEGKKGWCVTANPGLAFPGIRCNAAPREPLPGVLPEPLLDRTRTSRKCRS